MKIKTQFTYIDLMPENEEHEGTILLGFDSTPENKEIARKIFGVDLEIEIKEPTSNDN